MVRNMTKKMELNEYVRQISEHVTLIGNYYFSSYLVRGSRFSAVVEMGVTATVDLLISQLNHLEVEPDYLIVAHPHADHITGISGLMERFPKSTVVTGFGTRKFIEHPKALKAMIAEDRFISNSLHKIGFEIGRPSISNTPNLSEALEVKDAYRINLGELEMECFPVYGHAPGNIAINVEKDRVILVSDSLGFHFPSRCFCPLFFTGFKEYIQTLSQFYILDPLIIGLGHQGPIIREYASDVFARASQTAEDIATFIINYTKSSERLVDELFKRYYVDEFTIYTPENIKNCMKLLVKRAKEGCQ